MWNVMAKFNTKNMGTKTTNYEGGVSYTRSPRKELVAHVLTSLVSDQFYRNRERAQEDLCYVLDNFVQADDIEFVAKTAVYARDVMGVRSISHLLARFVGTHVKGSWWTKSFFEKVVIRPDDMTEIISLFKDEPIPNAIKKGFAKAFNKFNDYQIAKYKVNTRKVSLVDVVNLVHPVPTDKNKEALEKLVKGTLVSKDTWETKLTQIGQDSNLSVTEKFEKRSQAWKDLLTEGKLGYMAMLRNIRNILQDDPSLEEILAESLVNRTQIKRSRIFPIHLLKAFEMADNPVIEKALEEAALISCENIKPLDGKVVVALDISGSMNWEGCIEKGALFAFSIAKKMKADVIFYNNEAKLCTSNLNTEGILKLSSRTPATGGTYLGSVFNLMIKKNIKADHVIIISDFQSWIEDAFAIYRGYCKFAGKSVNIISIDMAGYPSVDFPEKNITLLSGFSANMYDVLNMVSQDPDALIHEIEKIKF